jgi:pyruvate dehydrogenase E1 component
MYNENYVQPAMPSPDVAPGILKGLYQFKPALEGDPAVHLFGSGTILNEALRAQQILAERYGVHADVWSVTSYNELRREALATERWNRLHPAESVRRPYILEALNGSELPIVAATDYMKVVPDQLSPWLPGRLVSLGTDGFGRSENRQHLRRFFEVSSEAIAAAALSRLSRDGKFDAGQAAAAVRDLGLEPDSADPATR